MTTAHLIDLLAQDAPLRWRLSSRLAMALLAGGAVAAVILVFGIGLRPDLATAVETIRVEFKFLFAVTLLLAAAGTVARAGRPDFKLGSWSFALAVAPLLLGIAVLAELMATPAQTWMTLLIGRNAAYCLALVPVLALPPLACLLLALRTSAPSHTGTAGAAAGFAAGGVGAVLYALHCPDDSPLFVAAWYSSAIAIVTTAGYLAGARLLKW